MKPRYTVRQHLFAAIAVNLFVLCGGLFAALPTILIDSATGSDTAASGAGPSTALTGSAAQTSADGLTLTLDGTPDLSGVASDGSHVIWFNNTAAGGRQFAKITGTNDTTDTVTVSEAFALSMTNKSWAIGGVRASISSTSSYRLIENNATSGDAMPGWIMEMKSGHSETITTTGGDGGGRWITRRAGNTTSTGGRITIRGESGAATLPVVTFAANAIAIYSFSDYWTIKDFEVRNSNATKTASVAVGGGAGNGWIIDGLKANHATNYFWKHAVTSIASGTFRNCDFGYAASNSITLDGSLRFFNCYIHHAGGHGILWTSGFPGVVEGSIIYANTGDGVQYTLATSNFSPHNLFINNTVDANTGDGMEVTPDVINLANLYIVNNLFTNNTGTGLKFSHANHTTEILAGRGVIVDGNNTYGNASAYLPVGLGTNDPGLDPVYTNASGGDFSIGTNLKAKGVPIGGTRYIGKTSATYSYLDPGAAQRQEAGAGAGIINFLRGRF